MRDIVSKSGILITAKSLNRVAILVYDTGLYIWVYSP